MSALTIRTRLTLAFALLVSLLIAAAVAGGYGLQRMRAAAAATIENEVALAQLSRELMIDVLQLRRFEKDVFLNVDAADRAASYADKWRKALQALSDAQVEAEQLASAAQREELEQFAQSVEAYRLGFESVMQDIEAKRLTSSQQANLAMSKFKSAIQSTDQHADALLKLAHEDLAKSESALAALSTRLLWTVALLALIAASAAVVCAALITKGITTQLSEVLKWSEAVAKGKLGFAMRIRSQDEIGQLMSALQMTDGRLCEIVSNVRNAASSVREISAEIARGNDDASQRAQNQAAALEETAGSMQQISSAVHQNASHTERASKVARAAHTAAQQGGVLVSEAVQAMGSISSHSQKIESIIGVIDEIAFQTNLLALNAAVEAARAGEQGRGFAVVASEVRSLAQRSATAAKEIKELIALSVDSVAAGHSLVTRSGGAISEIIERIHEVTKSMEEISAANQQQANGVAEVAKAVSSVDRTMQENAAMIEEITAASEQLKQQSQELLQVVAFFEVAGGATRAPVAAPHPALVVEPLEEAA